MLKYNLTKDTFYRQSIINEKRGYFKMKSNSNALNKKDIGL